jgi:hypothetical protein
MGSRSPIRTPARATTLRRGLITTEYLYVSLLCPSVHTSYSRYSSNTILFPNYPLVNLKSKEFRPVLFRSFTTPFFRGSHKRFFPETGFPETRIAPIFVSLPATTILSVLRSEALLREGPTRPRAAASQPLPRGLSELRPPRPRPRPAPTPYRAQSPPSRRGRSLR